MGRELALRFGFDPIHQLPGPDTLVGQGVVFQSLMSITPSNQSARQINRGRGLARRAARPAAPCEIGCSSSEISTQIETNWLFGLTNSTAIAPKCHERSRFGGRKGPSTAGFGNLRSRPWQKRGATQDNWFYSSDAPRPAELCLRPAKSRSMELQGGTFNLLRTTNVSRHRRIHSLLVGAFGLGVYRLFNYGGKLTDNGPLIGAMP